MKRYIITILIILAGHIAFGQDFFDALRYSQTNYGGTARSVSMGSAFGSLGGDFISASINPAGMGLYRSGEFTLSPTLNINGADASYLGTNSSDNKYRFNFDNISYVGVINTGSASGIMSVSFGFGVNRLKNFNNNISIVGNNAETTLLSYYTDMANKIGDPTKFYKLEEGLAYNTWLIDYDNNEEVLEGKYFNDLSNYSSYVINDDNGNFKGYGYKEVGVKSHNQRKSVRTSGRIDEYVMSLGLNVNHKLFFGGSISLLDLEYYQSSTFTESDDYQNSNYFKDYSMYSSLNHSGAGVNFKAGLIYRPFKMLRVGLAVHTPNFYTINCSESNTIDANFDQPVGDNTNNYSNNWNYTSPADDYQFELETPFKTIASASLLFGKLGIVSVDYEWQNYANAKFRDSGDNWDYSSKNTVMANMYQSTSNLRIGAELRATDNFFLRAGYQHLGNPWVDNYEETAVANRNDSFNTYSAGFGYRQQSFFIDFAYRLSDISTAYKVHEMVPNDPMNGKNIAQLNYTNSQATITLGFRF